MDKTIDPNQIPTPKIGQDQKQYARFIRDMNQIAAVYERNLGRVRWLQGKALNLVRPTIKSAREWKAFLASARLGATNAKYCRKIAKIIPEEKSSTMPYHEMLQKAYPSYRKEGDVAVKTDMEKEDTADFGETIAPQRGSNSPQVNPAGLSTLQKSLRKTVTTLQGWTDVTIETDIGFDVVENVKLDIAQMIEIARCELARIETAVQAVTARKVA